MPPKKLGEDLGGPGGFWGLQKGFGENFGGPGKILGGLGVTEKDLGSTGAHLGAPNGSGEDFGGILGSPKRIWGSWGEFLGSPPTSLRWRHARARPFSKWRGSFRSSQRWRQSHFRPVIASFPVLTMMATGTLPVPPLSVSIFSHPFQRWRPRCFRSLRRRR